MARAGCGVLILGLLVGLSGCVGADVEITGHNVMRASQFFGHVRLIGDGSDLTVMAGSKVTKLSIVGDDNRVTVHEQVTLNKIEFWGKNNTVSVPASLVVRTAEIGTNQIVRRPRDGGEPLDWLPPEGEAPAYRPMIRDEPLEGAEPEVEIEPRPQLEDIEVEVPEDEEPEFRPPPTAETGSEPGGSEYEK